MCPYDAAHTHDVRAIHPCEVALSDICYPSSAVGKKKVLSCWPSEVNDARMTSTLIDITTIENGFLVSGSHLGLAP
jgi:hypothetical protein